jgi:hypothetical protein
MVVVCGALVLSAVGGACNVFNSIDRCTSDSDCPSGATCDPDGRFCIKTVFVESGPPDASNDVVSEDAVAEDAVAPPACDASAPFGSPTLVLGFESKQVSSARFTPTETTALFSALSDGCVDETCADLFIARRDNRFSAFTDFAPLPNVNCPGTSEYWPTLSADGLVLFFESSRQVDGGCTNDHARIWTATRPSTIGAEFGTPTLQSLFAAASGDEGAPYLDPNKTSLYFSSGTRPGQGGTDIFVATFDEIGVAKRIDNVDGVNTPRDENMPVVTLDERSLFLGRFDATFTKRDIWVSTRASASASFGAATMVTELSSPDSDEWPSWVSEDGCRMYFVSNRAASDAAALADYRLWVAERPK